MDHSTLTRLVQVAISDAVPLVLRQLKSLEESETAVEFKLPDCRAKLWCALECYCAVISEAKNVCYHGKVYSVHTLGMKFSAFMGCYGLSESYARNLQRVAKTARKQTERFLESCDKVESACQSLLMITTQSKSKSEFIKWLAYIAAGLAFAAVPGMAVVAGVGAMGAGVGAMGVGAIAMGAGAVMSSGAIMGAGAVTGGGTMGVVGVVSTALGWRYRGNEKKFENFSKGLYGVRDVASKLKKAVLILQEKLRTIDERLQSLVQRRDGGLAVCLTLDSLYNMFDNINEHIVSCQADAVVDAIKKFGG